MSAADESGLSWYFSNANTRRYRNWFLQGIDWLGRKLSYLSNRDYEVIHQASTTPPGIFRQIKIVLWQTGIGAVLGAPGGLLRWFASIFSSNIDHTQYHKPDFTLSDYKQDNQEALLAEEVEDEEKAGNQPQQLKFLTLNVACLPYFPSLWNHHINEEFLRANSVRVEEIADQILEEKGEQPDVITLQEAFDGVSQDRLIARLHTTYPYIIHNVGDRFLNSGSGLMLFSKYPIIESEFHAYTNTMWGEETLANKGFLAAKIKISDSQFVSVYNTHTQSGGGILKRLQAWWGGTTSQRRGVEFGEIATHMENWESLAPATHPNLVYLSTQLTGDLNTGLNSERSMLAISTGKSNNSFQTGQIKYPGQNHLFSRFLRRTPENFIDIREEAPEVRGTGKANDPEKVAIAEEQDLFTGTAPKDAALQVNMQEHAEVAKRSNRKIIDAMFSSSWMGGFFKSKIVSFGNATDHFGVVGEMKVPEKSPLRTL